MIAESCTETVPLVIFHRVSVVTLGSACYVRRTRNCSTTGERSSSGPDLTCLRRVELSRGANGEIAILLRERADLELCYFLKTSSLPWQGGRSRMRQGPWLSLTSLDSGAGYLIEFTDRVMAPLIKVRMGRTGTGWWCRSGRSVAKAVRPGDVTRWSGVPVSRANPMDSGRQARETERNHGRRTRVRGRRGRGRGRRVGRRGSSHR